MLTIATETQIANDVKLLSIPVSIYIPEGDYEVLIVLIKKEPRKRKVLPAKPGALWFPTYQVPVNPSLTYSRNEIYGEEGR